MELNQQKRQKFNFSQKISFKDFVTQTKDQFQNHPQSFNEDFIVSLLNQGDFLDNEQYVAYPKQFLNMVKRHQITNLKLQPILRSLTDQNIPYKSRHCLVRVISQACTNGASIQINQLLSTIKYIVSDHNGEIISEFALLLGRIIIDLKDNQLQNLSNQLKKTNFMEVLPNGKNKDYLKNQLINKKIFITKTNQSNNIKNQNTKKQIKKPKAVVTKIQQQIKAQIKNTQSEQEVQTILSLCNALKKRNKNITKNLQKSLEPSTTQQSGSDLGRLDFKYQAIVKLYNKVKNTKFSLKQKDKDQFLPSVLQGDVFFLGGYLKRFIADRMIMAIFSIVTDQQKGKRKPQKLNYQAIYKAFSICKSKKQLRQFYFGEFSDQEIVGFFHFNYQPQKSNQIQQQFNKIESQFKNQQKHHYYWTKHLKKKIINNRFSQKELLEAPQVVLIGIGAAIFYNSAQIFKRNKQILNTSVASIQCYENICHQQLLFKVMNIINNQFQQIRIDALKSLYNMALIINDKILGEKQHKGQRTKRQRILYDLAQNDPNKQINQICQKLLVHISKFTNDNRGLLQLSMKNIENNNNTKDSIKYILQQSQKGQKFVQFFPKIQIIQRLGQLISFKELKKHQIDQQDKVNICRIMCGYMQNSNHRIDQRTLINLSRLIWDINSQEQKLLCKEVLYVINYYIQKTSRQQKLSSQIIPSQALQLLKHLMKQCRQKQIQFQSQQQQIISTIILHLFLKLPSNQRKFNLEIITFKLSDCRVCEFYGQQIQFQERNEQNKNQASVCYIAAKIIKQQIQDKSVQISQSVVNDICRSLNSVDKQTKIYLFKSLFLADYKQWSRDQIENIMSQIDVSKKIALDIQVYGKVLMGYAFRNYSQSNKLLTTDLQYLAQIYEFQSLQLQEKDYSQNLNNNILQTFKNQSQKQILEVDLIFQNFERILVEDENQQRIRLSLDILFNQASLKKQFSQNTILVVQHCYDRNENYYSNQVIKIIELIIRNGQHVSQKTMNLVVFNIYKSEDIEIRNWSYQLLNICHQNQDIRNHKIFYALQVQKAARVLPYCLKYRLQSQKHVLKYIFKKVDMGSNLSFDSLNYLSRFINSQPVVIQILENFVSNGNALDQQIIKKLVQNFSIQNPREDIVQLFKMMVKMKIQLTKKVPQILQSAFIENAGNDDSHVQNLILETLIKLVNDNYQQIQQKITQKMFNYYLEHYPKNIQKYEFLTFLQNEIKRNVIFKDLDIKLIKLLIKETDQNIKTKIIKINQLLLQKVENFSNETKIILLLELGLQRNTDAFKESIINFLKSQKIYLTLEDDKKAIISQYQHNLLTSTVFIQKLKENRQLLLNATNFNKLRTILQLQNQLVIQCLEIINSFNEKNFALIPSQLVDKVSNILFETNQKKISQICHNILFRLLKQGKKLKQQTLDRLLQNLNHDQYNQLITEKNLSLINENQTTFLINNSSFQKISQNIKKISQCLKKLSQKHLDGHLISRYVFDTILLINNNVVGTIYEDQLRQQLAVVISLKIGKDYSNYRDHKNNLPKIVNNNSLLPIVQTIQLSLINHMKQNLEFSHLFQTYKNIVYENDHSQLEKVLQQLIRYLLSTQNGSQSICLNFDLDKFSQIPDCLISFWEKLLYSDCQLLIYSSFKNLKNIHMYLKNSDGYDQFLQKYKLQILNNIDIGAEDLQDFIQNITSLKYLDYGVIRNSQQNLWFRQMALSSLVKKQNLSQEKSIEVYQHWLKIEDMKIFQRKQLNKILILFNLRDFKDQNILKILQILPLIDFGSIKSIVSSNKNILKEFQLIVIKDKLNQFLSHHFQQRYIKKLSFDISQKLPFRLILKVLNYSKKTNRPNEVIELLNFIQKYKIKESDIIQRQSQITSLLKQLKINILKKSLKEKSISQQKLEYILVSLFEKEWTFEQLQQMIGLIKNKQINESKSLSMLIQLLKIINMYCIKSEYFKQITDILKSHSNRWLEQINKIIVEARFAGNVKTRNLEDLIKSIKYSSLNSQKESSFEDLEQVVKKVKDKNLKSQFFLNDKPISEWNRDKIKQWAAAAKKAKKAKTFQKVNKKKQFIIEQISVIAQANNILTKHHLKDAQIIAVYLMASKNQNAGRLLQVSTGQGKSTIICLFAIIKALEGKKVDILTSSPVLAQRDAKQKASLYGLFNLSCANNNQKTVYLNGVKDCYKKDVVYGEAAQFQFDTLNHQYRLLKTLGDRKTQVAIVDEVDTMLIDDSSKIARLSSTVAGLDLLQPIYHFLWQQMISMQSKILFINGKMYMVQGTINYFDNPISMDVLDTETNQIVRIKNIQQLIKNQPQLFCEIPGDFNEFMVQYLDQYLRVLLGFQKENGFKHIKKDKDFLTQLKIPKNFRKFAQIQLKKWAQNALSAFELQQNVSYIVSDGLIKPVDNTTTGVVQNSTNWCNGLHQFLQRKHGLKMTSQNFTTNYLSNLGYIQRYGQNIYGLTGTLGSKKARQVLMKNYNVDLIEIPRSFVEQYISLQPQIAKSKQEWIKIILQSSLREANQNRGVLIICETIQDSILIEARLKQQHDPKSLKTYTMNDMKQQQLIQKNFKRQIIVATNLAGRGTDIKTDQIEKFGGMHVIVTFLPSNQRVQEQAFGRTSRQGKRGSGQMILNRLNLMDYSSIDQKNINTQRDIKQVEFLQRFQKQQLQSIKVKDKLFKRFCVFLNGQRNNKQSSKKSIRNKIKKKYILQNIIAGIQQKWAMLLNQMDDKINDEKIDPKDIQKKYQQFERQILEYIDSNEESQYKVIENPFYLINMASDIVMNKSFKDSNMEKAAQYIQQAIKKDPQFCSAAYMVKGWIQIQGKYRIFGSNQKQQDYLQKAQQQFRKAILYASEEISNLVLIQSLMKQSNQMDCDLFKQTIQKMNLIGSFIKSIESNIAQIEKSSRLLDIYGYKDYVFGGIQVTENEELIETLKVYYKQKRGKNGQLVENLEDEYNRFSIVFNSLTKSQNKGLLNAGMNATKSVYNFAKSAKKTILNTQILKNTYKYGKETFYNVTDYVGIGTTFLGRSMKTLFLDQFQKQLIKGIHEHLQINDQNGIKDQAIDTIAKIKKEMKLQDIDVTFQQPFDSQKLKTLLNPHLQFNQITQEGVINTINDHISYFERNLSKAEWSCDYQEIIIDVKDNQNQKIIEQYQYKKGELDRIKNDLKKQQNLKSKFDLRFSLQKNQSKKNSSQQGVKYTNLSLQQIHLILQSSLVLIELQILDSNQQVQEQNKVPTLKKYYWQHGQVSEFKKFINDQKYLQCRFNMKLYNYNEVSNQMLIRVLNKQKFPLNVQFMDLSLKQSIEKIKQIESKFVNIKMDIDQIDLQQIRQFRFKFQKQVPKYKIVQKKLKQGKIVHQEKIIYEGLLNKYLKDIINKEKNLTQNKNGSRQNNQQQQENNKKQLIIEDLTPKIAKKALDYLKDYGRNTSQKKKLDECFQIIQKDQDKNQVQQKPQIIQQYHSSGQQQKFSIKLKKVKVNSCKTINLLIKNILNYSTNTTFQQMDSQTSINLIKILRSQYIDFQLKFNKIYKNKMSQVLKIANQIQKAQQITIQNVKKIQDMYMSTMRPDLQIGQLSARGILYLLQICQKNPIPWSTVASLGLIAGAQILVGAVLISNVWGATVGMALVTQSMNQFINMRKAISSRKFDWSDYAKQKAVSLAISAYSIGWSGLKDSAKGVQVLIAAQKQVVEQAVVGGAMVFRQNIKGTVCKYIGTKIGQTAVRQSLNKACDASINLVFERAKPKITQYIQQKVFSCFSSSYLKNLVTKMFVLDNMMNKNGQKSEKLKLQIAKIVEATLNPQNNWLSKQWNSIGGPLCKQLLSDKQFYNGSLSFWLRIYGTLSGISQIVIMISKVHAQIFRKLSKIYKQNYSTVQILQKYGQINKQTAKKVEKILKQNNAIIIQQINKEDGMITKLGKTEPCMLTKKFLSNQTQEAINFVQNNIKTGTKQFINKISQLTEDGLDTILQKKKQSNLHYYFETFDLQKIKKIKNTQLKISMDQKKAIQFLQSIEKSMEQTEIDNFSQIMKSVTDSITNQMIRVMENNVISPWSSYAMGHLTNAISKRVQNNFLVDFQQCTQQQKEEKKRFQKLIQKQKQGSQLSQKEEQFLAKYDPYMTFEKQITANAQQYKKKYSVGQIIYYSKNVQISNKPPSQKVQQRAKQIRGGRSLTVAQMNVKCQQQGLNVVITEDPNYQLTKQQIEQGYEVIIYEKGKRDIDGTEGIGHYRRKNGEIYQQLQNGQGKNDCGLAVIKNLLKQRGIEKSIEQLRNETADLVLKYSQNFDRVIKSQQWIKQRHPKQANTLIMNGGLRDEILNIIAKMETIQQKKDFLKNMVNNIKGLNQLNKNIYKKTIQAANDQLELGIMGVYFDLLDAMGKNQPKDVNGFIGGSSNIKLKDDQILKQFKILKNTIQNFQKHSKGKSYEQDKSIVVRTTSSHKVEQNILGIDKVSSIDYKNEEQSYQIKICDGIYINVQKKFTNQKDQNGNNIYQYVINQQKQRYVSGAVGTYQLISHNINNSLYPQNHIEQIQNVDLNVADIKYQANYKYQDKSLNIKVQNNHFNKIARLVISLLKITLSTLYTPIYNGRFLPNKCDQDLKQNFHRRENIYVNDNLWKKDQNNIYQSNQNQINQDIIQQVADIRFTNSYKPQNKSPINLKQLRNQDQQQSQIPGFNSDIVPKH